jgi:TetR/AcrR family transcriptional regulator
MGRRQGPAEERREAILDAADAEFSERGYAGAAIRAMAKRAAVSSALLYWFFPSKADLFAAVLLRRADAQQVLVFPPGADELPPAEFLPGLAQGFFLMVSQGQQLGLLKMLLREGDQATEVITVMRGLITTRALGPLEHYFTRQIERGHIRPAPPEYIAQAFVGLFLGLVLRREILQEPISRTWNVTDYVDQAVRLFLQGVQLEPGAPPVPPAAIPTVVPTPAAKQVSRIELSNEQ